MYAEASLALKTLNTDSDGNIKREPVYYITTAFKGLLGKILSNFFAVICVLALGFMECMVKANSISNSLQVAFNIPSWQVGVNLYCLVLLVCYLKTKHITNCLTSTQKKGHKKCPKNPTITNHIFNTFIEFCLPKGFRSMLIEFLLLQQSK